MPARVVLTPNGCQKANWAQTRRAARREPGWKQETFTLILARTDLAKITCQNFTPLAPPQNWARHRHRSGGLTLVYKADNKKPALFLWKLGFHDPPPTPGQVNGSRISVTGTSNASSFQVCSPNKEHSG